MGWLYIGADYESFAGPVVLQRKGTFIINASIVLDGAQMTIPLSLSLSFNLRTQQPAREAGMAHAVRRTGHLLLLAVLSCAVKVRTVFLERFS